LGLRGLDHVDAEVFIVWFILDFRVVVAVVPSRIVGISPWFRIGKLTILRSWIEFGWHAGFAPRGATSMREARARFVTEIVLAEAFEELKDR
jgi:hypothetical protein